MLWDARGVATEGKPYEKAYPYPYFVRMRDGEVDVSSCNDLWGQVKRGDR